VTSHPPLPVRGLANQFLAAIWLVGCFAFAALNETVLPDRYFADSHHIAALALTATGPDKDSFITTAWVYRILGGFDSATATSLVTLGLFFIVLFRCGPWMHIAEFGPMQTVLYCFAGLEAAIYLAQYSKESLIVVIVAVLVFTPATRSGDLLLLAVVAGYAWLIRTYWFIIAVLYVAFRILLRKPKPWRIAWFVVIALVGCAVGFTTLTGQDLDSLRRTVAQTNSLYANTAIHDYVPLGGPAGGAANAVVTLLTLVVPVPLLLAGSPVYVVFAVLMTLLWTRLLGCVAVGTREGWFAADPQLGRAVSLLMAMLTVEAIFEPDYGSYIKHLTALLPLFVPVLKVWRDRRMRRELCQQ
jgi:hypothetical protein